jgi:hypothetical protein
MLSSAGCSSLGSAPVPEIIVRCPPLKTYSAETAKKAAGELRAMPPEAATPGMIRDYGVLRKQCAVTDTPAK